MIYYLLSFAWLVLVFQMYYNSVSFKNTYVTRIDIIVFLNYYVHDSRLVKEHLNKTQISQDKSLFVENISNIQIIIKLHLKYDHMCAR